MNVKAAFGRRASGIAAIGALALVLAACNGGNDNGSGDSGSGSSDGDELSGNLAGAGASSQEAAVNGWLAGFNDLAPGVSVSYDPTGSGTGREQFLAGAVSFAGSDAAFSPEEVEAGVDRCFGGEVIELPLYISPIAVIYNLPEVGADHLNLTPDVIAQIFNGDITSWDDAAIAEANPEVELPSIDIVPVNRSDDSGTTENFTEYLSQAAGGAWPHEPSQSWPISGTQSGPQTSGMLEVVSSAEGAIGYADASRAGELGTAAVGVGEEFVPFSPEAAAQVVDISDPAETATELRLTIDLARDTTEAGSYPIVQIAYSSMCSQYEDESEAANVKAFFEYVSSPEGQERAADPDVAGSAPISDELRNQVQSALDQIGVAGG